MPVESGVYVCVAMVANVSVTSEPLELTTGRIHTNKLLMKNFPFFSFFFPGPVSLTLLTPDILVVDPPETITIAVDVTGGYEQIIYTRNNESFSFNGSTNFAVSLLQFSNFFRNFTDTIPSTATFPILYSVTSVVPNGKSMSVDILVVQYGE